MASYPGLYRAKAVRRDGTNLVVQIPQIYGEALVTCTEFVGAAPSTMGMGWVGFRSASPDFPVWFGVVGVQVGGDGNGEAGALDVMWVGADPPEDPTTELWWDEDEILPASSLIAMKGVLSGAATALPVSPSNGDVWILAAPVPTAAPARSGGGAAQDGDAITWNGTAWLNLGPWGGKPGPQGETGETGDQGPQGVPGTKIWVGTQAQFDALGGVYDPITLYFVKP